MKFLETLHAHEMTLQGTTPLSIFGLALIAIAFIISPFRHRKAMGPSSLL